MCIMVLLNPNAGTSQIYIQQRRDEHGIRKPSSIRGERMGGGNRESVVSAVWSPQCRNNFFLSHHIKLVTTCVLSACCTGCRKVPTPLSHQKLKAHRSGCFPRVFSSLDQWLIPLSEVYFVATQSKTCSRAKLWPNCELVLEAKPTFPHTATAKTNLLFFENSIYLCCHSYSSESLFSHLICVFLWH